MRLTFKKSYSILFVLSLGIIRITNAQISIGFSPGVCLNYLKTNTSNLQFQKENPALGYLIEGFLEWKIIGSLDISISPSFIEKSYTNSRTDSFSGIFEKHINHYLQLPVVFTYNKRYKKVDFFFGMGPYGAYWVSGRVKGKVPDILNVIDSVSSNGQISESLGVVSYNEKFHFDTKRDNRFEFGWASVLGISYLVKKNCSFFIMTKYCQSITDQQKKYMINQLPRYNQTYTVSFGFTKRINFKRSKIQ